MNLTLYLCEQMELNYPKHEKLKSKTTIDALFSKGKSVSKYPLRLVYVAEPGSEAIKFGVSVSKKYFKKAVDRNYFKRLLRESYRHNKHLIVNQTDATYACMLFYQSKERLPYADIHTKTIQLFEKFLADIKK